MPHKFHIHVLAGQIFWLCVIVCLLALSALPLAVWSETPEQEEEPILRLDDGTVIELTEEAVTRKQPATSDSAKENILWSIPAKEPRLPLLFENSKGVPLLLYLVHERERYGEFHAVRVEDGGEQWFHPVWIRNYSIPVSPIFVEPWIYLGRGIWLEKMSPNDGKIIERYPARVHIRSLQELSEGAIEIQAEDEGSPAGQVTLRFHRGQFIPHIKAPQNLLASLDLFHRTKGVMNDSMEYYLNLHQIQREPLSPEYVVKWREFDLQKAEKAYRQAYQADPTNPYFAFYLGLSLYYQHREVEAEVYFQEAFAKTANFWEESFRLGGIVCERLGFTQWADKFYEQGAKRYFQEIPAPPKDVTLIDILIHFMGQRASSPSPPDRSLKVLKTRREIFPYTEGDTLFSRRYVRALLKTGQKEKAQLEIQRIQEMPKTWYYFDKPTPFSFVGFMSISFLLMGIIIVKNDVPHIKSIIRIGVYLYRRIAFSRRPQKSQGEHILKDRELSISPLRPMIRNILLSSYCILGLGIRLAYITGERFSHSSIGGKLVEMLFIVIFIGLSWWIRRHSRGIPSFQHLKLFVLMWVVVWVWMAWASYYLVIVRQDVAAPLPTIDRGHPNWVHRLNEGGVKYDQFQNRDIYFGQALVHHLSGDVEFARQAYKKLSDDIRALNNLGTLMLDDDPNGALEYFEQALQHEPNYAPALYNLGIVTNDQAKIEQAQAAAPWPLDNYQKYAPGKPWIVVPTIREWSQAVYWSHAIFGYHLSFVPTPMFLQQFLAIWG